jgi:hypothetical protein
MGRGAEAARLGFRLLGRQEGATRGERTGLTFTEFLARLFQLAVAASGYCP